MIKTKIKDTELVRKRQKQICRGAMKVFQKKGYHAASIREIAKASRISLGSLYDYIEKKEDILFLVHTSILEELYRDYEEVSEKSGNYINQFIKLIKEGFYSSSYFREEILFIYTETKSLDKKNQAEILKRESHYVSFMESLIREGNKQGVFDCKRPGIFANIMTFLMIILPLRGWNILEKNSEEELLEELISLLLKGLNVKNVEMYAKIRG